MNITQLQTVVSSVKRQHFISCEYAFHTHIRLEGNVLNMNAWPGNPVRDRVTVAELCCMLQ